MSGWGHSPWPHPYTRERGTQVHRVLLRREQICADTILVSVRLVREVLATGGEERGGRRKRRRMAKREEESKGGRERGKK